MASVEVISKSSALHLSVSWTESSPAVLGLRAGPRESPGRADRFPTQPLVEAMADCHGREAGRRYVTTVIGARLRHRSHAVEHSGAWQTLRLSQVDELTGLEFTSELSMHDHELGIRSRTHVRNNGTETVILRALSSLVFADFGLAGAASLDAMTLLRGHSEWMAEGRWSEVDLRSAGLPRLHPDGAPFLSRGCIEASNGSSWSTAYELPVLSLADPVARQRWSFQIEHNGAWLWQVGELADGLYVAMFGPTDELHQWQVRLMPGDSFTTVPASMTVEPAEALTALPALTAFRRTSLRHAATAAPPVVFNDYMNTVNGDPTAQVLHPLIDAAADAGADVFVIDAGWYANDEDWWDSVGEWRPSTRRFPQGIETVLDHIRQRGMRPGLWLEPEVVGVKSPVAVELPDEAFLSRDGCRFVEEGRYHLDYSSEATRTAMTTVMDRLIGDLGVSYFKFDYNIRAGAGSNGTDASVGNGLLRHNRGYLDWVDHLRARYPELMLENCASGGMRADFATVSRFDLQSSSDQDDLHAYPPIAAAAPMLLTPEQAGNWAYPQPDMSDDDLTFTLCTGVLGRLYLSGWLSGLTSQQQRLVAAAVRAHREVLDAQRDSTPVWPLGLPRWTDVWIVLGLHRRGDTDAAAQLYLTVWRRADTAGGVDVPLPLPPSGLRWSQPSAVFPDASPLAVTLSPKGDMLTVLDSSGSHAARVLRLTAEPM